MGIEAIGQTAWAIMTALLAKDKSAMGQTLSKYPHTAGHAQIDMIGPLAYGEDGKFQIHAKLVIDIF